MPQGKGGAANGNWWTTEIGIQAKANELGIERTMGEADQTFRNRVFFVAGEGPWTQE